MERRDFELLVVANEGDIDMKPLQSELPMEFKPLNHLNNPEPYVGFQMQTENLLLHPHTRAQGNIASDVRGSQAYADGTGPASLYLCATR